MIGSTWDIEDARALFRDDAVSFGDQLFQIAVERIKTGKSKRLKMTMPTIGIILLMRLLNSLNSP